MTINDLIDFLNKHELAGDLKLRVHAFGGMRGGKDIERASIGFDWDHGAIILHPKQTLTLYKPKSESP